VLLRLAQIVERTEAEGPGVRTALWTQGCSIRCAGCCNPEMFSVTGGRAWSIPEVLSRIEAANAEGVTILGGEPLDQPGSVIAVAEAARALGQSVVVFTGFRRAEVERRAPAVLDVVDVLVDGPFDHTQPEAASFRPRRWIGSRNQGLHFLTTRYGPDDFHGANTVELRLAGGQLTVNGWPASGIRR
jgi:anaerobic ribonucleoside-triphosphate reductase activating protein